MRALAAIFVAFAIAACVSSPPPVRALTDSTAVERHVLRYYRSLASLYESVGDEPIAYTLDRSNDLRTYQQLIAVRYATDLQNEYPAGIRPATRIFLLVGERGNHDLIHLIRLGSTSADGAFERLAGLTYVFDRSNRSLVSVLGTEY